MVLQKDKFVSVLNFVVKIFTVYLTIRVGKYFNIIATSHIRVCNINITNIFYVSVISHVQYIAEYCTVRITVYM